MALILNLATKKAYIRLSAKVDFDNKNIEVGVFPFETKADYGANNIVPWMGQMLKLNPTHTFPYAKETVDILRFAHEKMVEWLTTDETEPIMVDGIETGRRITKARICAVNEVVIDL